MPALHHERRARLATYLTEAQIDAALITRLVNVRYLTGLDSSNAALLVPADGPPVLATDSRYTLNAAAEAPDLELLVERQVAPALAVRGAADGRISTLAIEAHDVTMELSSTIVTKLGATHRKIEIVHLGRVVERFRAVKDDSEIALIAEACAISCRALEDLYGAGGILGRTEREIARDLEWRMFDHGADGLAFETVVASGPNSAVPHHRPTERTVGKGDFLKIDFGARYQGYLADCTRTSVVGAEPAGWQREIYDIVAQSQRLGCEALRVGAACLAVDQVSRAVVEESSYAEHRFRHGTGHGIGLEAHEYPTLGYSATGTLADRMAVTVEPGIYLPGRGGVRIEDTLAVRASGGPELLTPTTKDLLVLDA